MLAIASVGCIPSRDNPSDPSNRPSIEMEVTVGGRTAALGGRSEIWMLDATGSRAKHGSLDLQWEISTDGPDLVSDVAEWEDAGTGFVVLSTAGSLLRASLLEVREFEGFAQPGTGVARRWIRLTARDARSSARTEIAITVVNNAPSIDLGIDRRIAPGGQWWTGTGAGALDAEPWEVVIDANVVDVDGDAGEDGIVFTPGYEGRWTVRGQLAAFLAVDGEGTVNPDFVENGGRSVRFPAPLFPTRGELSLEVWDLLDPQGNALANSTASKRVDVLTSAWILDPGSGELQRADTSGFRVQGLQSRVLASDGRRALVGFRDAGEWSLHLEDHRLQDAAAPVPIPTIPRGAVADGAGGWWVTDGPGNIGHLREESGDLVFDKGATRCPPSPYSSCVGPAGTSVSFHALAPSGTGSVWALAYSSDFSEDRLLHLDSSGSVLVEEPALPNAPGINDVQDIVVDDAGEVWLTTRTTNPADPTGLMRRGAAPEALPDTTGDIGFIPRGAGFDALTGAFVVLTQEPGDYTSRLYRRDPDGTWTYGVVPRATQLIVDRGSGDALLARDIGGAVGAIDRIDTRTFVQVESRLGILSDRMVPFEGGSLLVGEAGGGPLHWFEAGARAESADFADVLFLPGDTVPDGLALDPATGEVWFARHDIDVVQRFGPDGTLLSTSPLPADADRARIAIDPVDRTGWIVAGQSLSTAMLFSFPIPAAAFEETVLTPVPGIGPIHEMGGISVIPGDRVCIGGYPGTTHRMGFAWVPSTQELLLATPEVFPGFEIEQRAFAQPRDGSCWFFDASTNPAPTTGTARLAADGSTELFDWPSTGNNSDATGIADIDSTDLVFAIGRGDGMTPWIGWYSPGTPALQSDPTFPTLDGSQPALMTAPDDVKRLSGDGFYGHYFLGIEDNGGAGPMVLRLDTTGLEVDRYTGPLRPVPVCR